MLRDDDRSSDGNAKPRGSVSLLGQQDSTIEESSKWVEEYVDRTSRILDKRAWPKDR